MSGYNIKLNNTKPQLKQTADFSFMIHQYAEKKITIAQIKAKVIEKIVLKGVDISFNIGSIWLSSLFIRIGCQSAGELEYKDQPILWMLGKEGLNEDLLVSVSKGNWAYPVKISRGIPKVIARHYLPPGIDDNSYETDDGKIELSKDQYRNTWQKIFRCLQINRPQAITSGNFGYYAERELAAAAELENIPFIAMHKECLKSEGRLTFFKEVYQRRGRFKGRKIIVYNQRERHLQIDSGIALPEQVLVCGMPRLDRLHHWRCKKPERPNRPATLLALGFMPKTGLPRIPRKGVGGSTLATYEYIDPQHKKLGWEKFFRNYHEVLVKLAVDYPDFIVQLKLKARHRDAEPSIKLIEALNPPSNFNIIVGGDPLDLIKNSDVVCGFNTTAVLEGLAAGLPVVTPEFDEVNDPCMRDFAVNFGNATVTPNDPISMYNALASLLKQHKVPTVKLSDQVKEALETWVGNSDGRSGERVKKAFVTEMAVK